MIMTETASSLSTSDFERLYEREFAPHVAGLEAKRQRRLKSFYLMIGLFLALFAGFFWAVIGFELYRDYALLIPVILVVLFAAAFILVSRPVVRQRTEVKDLMIEPLCRILGELQYQRKVRDRPLDPKRFEEIGVVRGHSRVKLEDYFAGRHRDTDFQMVEAKLATSGKNSSTVFKGLLFDIAVPRPFSCKILLVGDKGALVNKIGAFFKEKFSGLEPLELGNQAFDARYEVYSDDPKGARELLTPDFLATMVALADAADRKALNAAMVEGRFLLALPRSDNLFEIGKLHRPLTHLKEDVEELVTQMTIPHRVIDFLHGDRPASLA